ncbi:MAG: response regulator transcription factor [Deltaproteobacteria bacterium]|nr:response regulator transcription factor [Deltaproteobacteria bacterium]
MISVLVLEERSHLRDALGQLIGWKQPTFGLAAACSHPTEIQLLIDQGLAFDVVVLDPTTTTGLEGLKLLTSLERPVVGLCEACPPELLMAFLRAGGKSLILRGEGPERLLGALEAVLAGGASFSPALARHLVGWVLEPARIPRTERPEQLTPRELEVLSQLAAGQTYAETGEILGIGLGTVQSHVKNIYRKLDVSTKTEAATLALAEGLLPGSPSVRSRG